MYAFIIQNVAKNQFSFMVPGMQSAALCGKSLTSCSWQRKTALTWSMNVDTVVISFLLYSYKKNIHNISINITFCSHLVVPSL